MILGKLARGLWFAALLVAVAACDGGGGGGGGAESDSTPPTVVGVFPVDEAVRVARTTLITATFSEVMDPESLNEATVTLDAGGPPVGISVATSGRTVTITPDDLLDLGTLYTVTISTGARDTAGNRLASEFTWFFVTETTAWPGTRQFGTVNADAGNAVATDVDGNVYVAGSTGEDLNVADDDDYQGGTDLFLAKFSPVGELLFTRQLGTAADDEALAVAVDGSGNVYVAGSTGADLDGAGGDDYQGGTDLFLAKFRSENGDLLFTRQLGTAADDEASGVAVDGLGNVYVAGSTGADLDVADGDDYQGGTDFFVAKFGPAGALLFTRQLGTANDDRGFAVATDADGDVYVAGSTGEDLDGVGGDPYEGGSDIFLAKFGSAGALLFTRQLGTVNDDMGFSVATDAEGDVYVAGSTGEDLDGAGGDSYAGGADIFLAKFGPAGALIFTRQIGTAADDEAFGVATSDGNVYVSGSTGADLDGAGGDPYEGGTDLFVAEFGPAGALLFTRQLGTANIDKAFGVAPASLAKGGNVFVSGETFGDLDGNINTGGADIFLIKLDAFGALQ